MGGIFNGGIVKDSAVDVGVSAVVDDAIGCREQIILLGKAGIGILMSPTS